MARLEDEGHEPGRHQDHRHREYSHQILHSREYQVGPPSVLSLPKSLGSGIIARFGPPKNLYQVTGRAFGTGINFIVNPLPVQYTDKV
jgi:hypothetical protein